VPNYQSPTIDPTTQSAIQQQVMGIISTTRGSTETGTDLLYYIQAMSSFGRDVGVFTNTDSRFITEWLGNGIPIYNSDFYGGVVWDNEFRVAKAANLILTNLPGVSPAYSAKDASLIEGVVQTWKAYNFMLLAETRDTNGVPVAGITEPVGQVAPILCNKLVWASIVSLLDSGEAALDQGKPASGTGPLPVSLPPGFNSASLAGPSTTPGTFAGFNRALRAKAGLEYAYAIARSAAGSAPTPTTAGSPDAAALMSADGAAKASFIYNGGTVEYVQLTPTNYTDPLGVYHSFSGASGDQPNPAFGGLTYIFVLNAADSEIINDPRAGKIITNSSAPGQSSYNSIVSNQLTIGTYLTASSPIPIVRNEDVVLLEAAIQLGLGNGAQAVALINAVRSAAGAPAVAPSGYVAIRNQLLTEFRASNLYESGEYRTIMIRNYGLESQYTSTWGKDDLHTMVEPIPVTDNNARHGNITPQCN
jgi:hypothetical protein